MSKPQRPATEAQKQRMVALMANLSELHAERCLSFVGSVARAQRCAPPAYQREQIRREMEERRNKKARALSAIPTVGGESIGAARTPQLRAGIAARNFAFGFGSEE